MQAPRSLASPSDEAPNCWIPYSINVQVAGEAESGRQHLYLCNHIRQSFISHSLFLCLEPLASKFDQGQRQPGWGYRGLIAGFVMEEAAPLLVQTLHKKLTHFATSEES